MKKLLVLFILGFFSVTISSQSLLPIIDPNILRFVVINSFELPNDRMERWKFSTSSTLTDAGKTYYELLNSNQEDGNDFAGSGRYFREEANRFYLHISPTAGERLLYDMNLSLRDSIIIDYKDGTRKMVVTEVGSVTFSDQKTRKRLSLQCVTNGELESGDPAVWIEGIGRLYEPFVDFSHCSIFDGARPSIVCIYDGGHKIYTSENAPEDCWIQTLNTYTTDMDRSTIWYSSSFEGSFADGDCRRQINVAKVVRDTLIDNRLCRIVGASSGNAYLPECEIPIYQKEGKMYFYEDGMWKLLYDFNAQEGDTVTYYVSKKYTNFGRFSIPIPYNQALIDNNPFRLVVQKIDTIYSSIGLPLKKFTTQNLYNVHGHFMGDIIEQAGSLELLFGNNVMITAPQCAYTLKVGLRCYSDDDISIKFAEEECDKLTATNEDSFFSASLYPNPGHDKITIHLDSGLILPISYQIHDMAGKNILNDTKQLVNFDINTSHLTSGLYIITIQDSQGRFLGFKWIKE